MAYIYEMAIRCPNQWVSQALSWKYSGQTLVFNGAAGIWPGPVCRFRSESSEIDGEYWVSIVPSCVTESGLAGGESECNRANEFCNAMYGMLKNDAFFDYALAHVEVSGFRKATELVDEMRNPHNFPKFDGLVVKKDFIEQGVLDALGFQEFSETHVWLPKKLHAFSEK